MNGQKYKQIDTIPEVCTNTLDSVPINNEDLCHVVSQHFTRVANIYCCLYKKATLWHIKILFCNVINKLAKSNE